MGDVQSSFIIYAAQEGGNWAP